MNKENEQMRIPGDRGLLAEIREIGSNGRHLDLTRGSISRTIWIIALPQIITNLAQSLFSVVDMFWVGKLGSASLAAVAIAGTLMMVLFMVIMGVGTGAAALVARSIGGKLFERANSISANAISLAVFLSIPVAIIGYLNSFWLLHLMGADQTVQQMGTEYLQILFLGSTVVFLTFVINAVLQGTGDSLTPMKILTGALLVNALLDPILIFGWSVFPRMGIRGAAWATVISRTIACIVFIYYLKKGRLRIVLKTADFKLDMKIISRILKIGLPASIQLSLRGIMGIVVMGLVAQFGTTAIAAYGVGNRLFMIALFPGFGFGIAAASLVGQNLGAGKPARSRTSAFRTVYYYLLFLSVLIVSFAAFPQFIISAFNSDPEVIRIGAKMLRILSVGLPFLALSLVLNRSLSGAGDTFSPMLITMISLWGIQVPLAFALSRLKFFGVSGIFWAASIALIAAGTMALFWFNKGYWTQKSVFP